MPTFNNFFNQLFKTKTLKPSERTTYVYITFGVLLALIILISIILLIIRPNWQKITLLKQEWTAKQESLTKLEHKLQLLAAAKIEYDQIATSEAVIEETIADGSDVPGAVKRIEKIVTNIIDDGGPLVIQNLSIEEMPNDFNAVQPALTAIQEERVRITLNLIGDYQAIRDFIQQLKSLRHNFSIEKITFTSPEVSESTQLLEASLNIVYYYY